MPKDKEGLYRQAPDRFDANIKQKDVWGGDSSSKPHTWNPRIGIVGRDRGHLVVYVTTEHLGQGRVGSRGQVTFELEPSGTLLLPEMATDSLSLSRMAWDP